MDRLTELKETQAKINEEIRFLRNQDTAGTQCVEKGISSGMLGGAGNREKSAEEIIADLFTYHPPDQQSAQCYETIRDAAKHLVLVIWKNCPYGADRTAAIRKLRETVMTANAAIALRGVSL